LVKNWLIFGSLISNGAVYSARFAREPEFNSDEPEFDRPWPTRRCPWGDAVDELQPNSGPPRQLIRSIASVIEQVIGKEAAGSGLSDNDDNLSKIERAANGPIGHCASS
jgi:hypothetical protein